MKTITEIRKVANTGLILGSERFRLETEQLTANANLISSEAQSRNQTPAQSRVLL